MDGRCREQALDHGYRFALGCGKGRDSTPTVHDGLVNGQDPPLEAGGEIHLEPGLQPSPTPARTQPLHPLPDLIQCQDAQKQDRFIRLFQPAQSIAVRFGPNQLGNDIGIEKEAAHRSLFRNCGDGPIEYPTRPAVNLQRIAPGYQSAPLTAKGVRNPQPGAPPRRLHRVWSQSAGRSPGQDETVR